MAELNAIVAQRRPVTLFTGQWADLKFEVMCEKAEEFGYEGLELACWGDHFEVGKAQGTDGVKYCKQRRAIMERHNLKLFAISNHLVGQAVLDNIDARHKGILPPDVWGDGNPEGVARRAIQEMKNTAYAAENLGVSIVNGFTGSSIWNLIYDFPPTPKKMIDAGYELLAERWNPILDEFRDSGVKFGLEVHPTEIAFDIYSAERALKALDNRAEFGFNFDPSHFIWQGVDPVEFIRFFPDRIYHVHMKDASVTLNGRSGINCSHLPFGDPRRGWDFRSVGRGSVRFEEIIRALNAIKYVGPLSVEWEDMGMDRDAGAKEACKFVKEIDFSSSSRAFDAAFGD